MHYILKVDLYVKINLIYINAIWKNIMINLTMK